MEYYIVAIVSALVTWISSAVVLKIAKRKKWHAEVRERDVHSIPTPRLGGIAMFCGLIAAVVAVYFVPIVRDTLRNDTAVFGVLTATCLIAVVGIIDDIYDIDWMLKLGAQIGAASLLAWQGVQILSLPFGSTLIVVSPIVNLVLTVLLIVAVMNAVNFIDGLDGLAAGFTLISSGFFFVYTRILADTAGQNSAITFAGLIAASTFGMCLGFLPWNLHRAKLFMGDTGALLVGFLLAAATISVTGQLNPGALNQKLVLASYIPIILPFALLLLPLADMLLAVIRRIRAGRSPFKPDRKHLHHRLLDYGHSHLQVVIIFHLWTVTIALSCLLVFVLQSFLLPAIIFISGSLLCLLITVLPAQRVVAKLRTRRESTV
ncbi:undecaprenyl/decaprenyl-phosphate alpha-N-acetylglucosaminyl 1-phosphate transferase [Canibacter sp. lx-45]|uniref:glycosyltransferase family 4 protein n=1 Tax=Canibacter zhuwentaonis TaxID=2837491 RepID=UPI001BDD1DEA|nr:undecaprenyl/decaprenyl-phosphate alpha-N-acetylglucosaminyl 1-phosphate transferase [Canibacter zhuwentaonis]